MLRDSFAFFHGNYWDFKSVAIQFASSERMIISSGGVLSTSLRAQGDWGHPQQIASDVYQEENDDALYRVAVTADTVAYLSFSTEQ